MIYDDFLWVEKYRPKTIEETTLPVDLKNTFQQFINQKNIPNLLLSGPPGVGKTTIARAMLEELGCEYIIINGSMKGNIDTLRNEILDFASTVSFIGGRKYVILDEADYLNSNSTQPALRNFMEEFSRNCGFILTCNFKNRIIEPIHSRCSVIEFSVNKKEKPKLAANFFKHVCEILQKESVEYDPSVIAEVINKYFPDWRRVINELQRYSVAGKIDSGIFINLKEETFNDLLKFVKAKNYTDARKWVKENVEGDINQLYDKFFDCSPEICTKQSAPQMDLITAKYAYQNSFVANPSINFMAYLVELMVDCEFQK